jgi:hypothetical protein
MYIEQSLNHSVKVECIDASLEQTTNLVQTNLQWMDGAKMQSLCLARDHQVKVKGTAAMALSIVTWRILLISIRTLTWRCVSGNGGPQLKAIVGSQTSRHRENPDA